MGKISIFGMILFTVSLSSFAETKILFMSPSQQACAELENLPKELQASVSEKFDSHSVNVANFWSPLSPSEIASTKAVLVGMDRGQDAFHYAPYDDGDGIHFGDFASPSILPSVRERLHELAHTLLKYYEQRTRRNPHFLVFNLRVTSDHFGHRVTPLTEGGDGLHTHSEGDRGNPAKMDFLLSLDGSGPLIKINGKVRQMDANQLVALGDKVRHGSSQSDDLRLLIVGSIE